LPKAKATTKTPLVRREKLVAPAKVHKAMRSLKQVLLLSLMFGEYDVCRTEKKSRR
jgi:hypothetical protein